MAYFLVHSRAHSMYLFISFLYSLKMTHENDDHDEENFKKTWQFLEQVGRLG